MSTKKLSRTVNETGKSNRAKYSRKYSRKSFRAAERAYLDDIRKEPDLVDEIAEPSETQASYGWHGAHIAPVVRWLGSQSGRLWNDVYSDICKQFSKDSDAYKTLMGRVEEVPDYTYGQYKHGLEYFTKSYYKNTFYVDDNGILRKKEKLKRPSYSYYFHWNRYPHLIKWLDGRIISKVGDNYYWNIIISRYFAPDNKWRAAISANNLIYQFLVEKLVFNKQTKLLEKVPTWKEPLYFQYKYIHSRQSNGLSNIDIKYFESLPELIQKKILKWAPNATEKISTGWY